MTTLRPASERYEVGSDAPFPGPKKLTKLPDVESLAPPVEEQIETTYFDTADLALTRAGITISRQSGGPAAGWHIELPTAGAALDIRLPLGRAVHTVPKAGRDVVEAFTGGDVLSARARTLTTRTTHTLLDVDGTWLGALHDDDTTGELIEDTVGHDEAQHWRVWQLDVGHGRDDLRYATSSLLDSRGAGLSTSIPALARIVEVTDPVWVHPGFPTSTSAATADTVLAHVVHEVSELRRCDPLVRADSPDAVHRMRVATRRLRSALATYRPYLDREVVAEIRAELAWIATDLGAARDAEVTRNRLAAVLSRESPDLVDSSLHKRLDRDLADRYKDAHRKAVESMQSARYRALLERLDGLVSSPPWTKRASKPSRAVLPARLRRDWKRLARRFHALDDTVDPDDLALRLHQVRKAAKRLRYGAEALIPAYGKRASRLAKAAKKIQTVLGHHQDSVMVQRYLRSITSSAAPNAEAAFALGVVYAREDTDRQGALRSLDTAWFTASDKKLRRWLT